MFLLKCSEDSIFYFLQLIYATINGALIRLTFLHVMILLIRDRGQQIT